MRVLLILLAFLLAICFGDWLGKALNEVDRRQVQDQSTQTICAMVLPEALTAKGKATCGK